MTAAADNTFHGPKDASRPMPATVPRPTAHTTEARFAHPQYWNGRLFAMPCQ